MPNYGLRPLASKDMTLLARWLAEPHVAAWWRDRDSELEGIGGHIHIDSISVEPFVVDPDPVNAAAIRCYEKVGFRPIGRRQTEQGEVCLMAIDTGEEDNA